MMTISMQRLPQAEVQARTNWHRRTQVVTKGPLTQQRIKEYGAIRDMLARLRGEDCPVWLMD